MTYIIGDSGTWVCGLCVYPRLRERDDLGHEVGDDQERGSSHDSITRLSVKTELGLPSAFFLSYVSA